MVAGIFATVTGYVHPPLIFGFICGSIGSGLLFTLTQYSSSSAWIGYQVRSRALAGPRISAHARAVPRRHRGRLLPADLCRSSHLSVVFCWTDSLQVASQTVHKPGPDRERGGSVRTCGRRSRPGIVLKRSADCHLLPDARRLSLCRRRAGHLLESLQDRGRRHPRCVTLRRALARELTLARQASTTRASPPPAPRPSANS